MTAEEKLHIVYLLITAAQRMIEQGEDMQARGLIQTARLVAVSSDAFLEANMEQVNRDLALAESKILGADRVTHQISRG